MVASKQLLRFLIGTFALTLSAAAAIGQDRDAGTAPDAESLKDWRYARTPNPLGGADAISIMHTADTSKSDFGFAGITIRCGEVGTEALIILLEPLSMRTKPRVIFGDRSDGRRLDAKVAPPGTAILLPGDAKNLVDGPWRGTTDLSITVDTGQSSISGVVPLNGLDTAFKYLTAKCPSRASR